MNVNTTFIKTVTGDKVAHLKQQNLDVSIDFHALFHHYMSVESCCTVVFSMPR